MTRVVYHEGKLPPFSPGTRCTAEEGKTRQSEADQADINWIVTKYEKTGQLTPVQREGVFMDLTEMPNFQGALNQVRKAEEYFMSLPPDVRAEFDNDAAVMLDAWNAREKSEIFERIGLLKIEPGEPAPVAASSSAAAGGSGTA